MKKKRTTKSQLASGALAVGAAVAAAQSAEAAAFNVTNLNDSGAGSLRQAIADANALAGADTITFQAGLTGTITLTTDQLYISDSVDIQGPGPASITVSGNNTYRVFYLYNSTALLDVTISGLTITEGTADAGGGIIDFGENLVLDNVVVTGNHADFIGGGVAVTAYCSCDPYGPGSVTITGSTISDNTAFYAQYFGVAAGVGIYVATQVTIEDTTISGNDAQAGFGGLLVGYVSGSVTLDTVVISDNDAGLGYGGGAGFDHLAAGLTIQSSTIRDNDASGVGGGLAVQYSLGDFQIIDSTISGNEVVPGEVTRGGGIYFYAPAANLVVENSTISGNSAADPGDGGGLWVYAATADIRHTTISGNTAGAEGGGIYAYSGVVALSNSIVANDTATPPGDLAGFGTFDVSFSLVEDSGGANINDVTPADNIFGVDPQLGALANNGGPTETHKPALTSPAVGAGDPAFAPPPANDQRGLPREVPNGELDMGSVELQYGTVQFAVSTDSVAETAGTIQITVTRTGGSDGAASVPVSVSGGTAMGGAVDYTFGGTTLNWIDGDAAPKMFNITINDDLVFEGNETIILQLGTPTGAALGAPASETVTILDNETQPTVSVSDVSLNEGNAGPTTFPFLVTLSGQSAFTVTVNFTTNPVSAGEGTDYADNTGMVTFAPLDTSETVNVTVNGDPNVEPNETFDLVLSSPSGTTINDGTGAGTIVNDDVATTTDLSIQKTIASPGPFAIGQNITFTITVTNNGPATATGVSVTDTIPSNTTFVSSTPSQGSCSGTTTVVCNLGTINNGASPTIQLIVRATAPGSGSNSATVAAVNDSTANNNTAAAGFSIAVGEAPTLTETMQLMLAALLAMIALGVIGKRT